MFKERKKKKFKIFLLPAPFRGSSLPKHPGLMPPGIALWLPGALLGQGFSAFLVPQLSRFGIYILSFILAWDLQWSFRLATLTDFRCPQRFLPSALLIQLRREEDLTQMPTVVRLYFRLHPPYPHIKFLIQWPWTYCLALKSRDFNYLFRSDNKVVTVLQTVLWDCIENESQLVGRASKPTRKNWTPISYLLSDKFQNISPNKCKINETRKY